MIANIPGQIFGSTSTLTIPATEEYSNANVTCLVAIHDRGVFLNSDPVVLRVQGMLEATLFMFDTIIIIEIEY